MRTPSCSLVIIDGRRRYRVRILHPETELDVPAAPTDQRDAFVKLWRRMETDFSKPRAPFGGPELAMATRLAQRETFDILKRTVLQWYLYHYEPVREQGYHPLVWFAHCLPEVKKELSL